MNKTIENTSKDGYIADPDDLILVTGAAGFIGSRLINSLLDLGFRNIRCFARPYGKGGRIEALRASERPGTTIELFEGNLLSKEDCSRASEGVSVIFHLAAGRGEKSFPDAYMNSVITTRNLMETAARHGSVRRFVSISSFVVYTNQQKPGGRLLDESCPIETHPEGRGGAYGFAKGKQEQMVRECGDRSKLPYVIVRPGYVYGPGNLAITARAGLGTFGIFLHLGGSNTIPFTYVDNCADAIALAGLKPGVDGEVFNVVDDELPTSRQFLRQYKKNVKRFSSIYLPHVVSYALCYFWERYSARTQGQLPPNYNRREWHVVWKRTRYSNHKLKTLLGWTPRVSTREGMSRYFEACRNNNSHA
jgi:nucleoside-diphosphate-sugar epimerase